MGRPRGSKNRKTRSSRTKRVVTRRRRESFEESVICLAKNLEIKINPAVTFDRLLSRVKNVCRRTRTQAALHKDPELYQTWVNILMREASV